MGESKRRRLANPETYGTAMCEGSGKLPARWHKNARRYGNRVSGGKVKWVMLPEGSK